MKNNNTLINNLLIKCEELNNKFNELVIRYDNLNKRIDELNNNIIKYEFINEVEKNKKQFNNKLSIDTSKNNIETSEIKNIIIQNDCNCVFCELLPQIQEK